MEEVVGMKRIEIIKRAGFFKHDSRMILKFDLSNLKTSQQVSKVVEYFVSIVEQMPKKSILGCVDFRNTMVSPEITEEMIRLAEYCNPHFKATAVVALDISTKNLAKSVINHFGRIKMQVFYDDKKANEWLVSQ